MPEESLFLPKQRRRTCMAEFGRAPESAEVQVRRVVDALKGQNRAGTPDAVIEQTVREAFAEREGARIKDFVSLLAERAARERLRRMEEQTPTAVST
jgi:hypothetical protein